VVENKKEAQVPTRKEATTERGAPQADSLTLTDLDQVKVLADPLRIRILEELCTEERTTKQVAQRLGEKPTKLYHHVEALERVGLIRLARTRQNRGTIEKYYLAVARQFRADPRIFSAADAGSGAEGDALRAMISTVFDRTADEIRGLVDRGRGREGIEEKGVLSYLEIRTDEKHGRQIRARLLRLLRSLEGTPERGAKTGGRRYRLTLAFYPLEPDP
jgi:DNA-binding transcriptional ArsR family regulator